MSAERQPSIQLNQQDKDVYMVELPRVLELEQLLIAIGHVAKTRIDKEHASGFVRLFEDKHIDIDDFGRTRDLKEDDRHRHIDDTIRRFRNGGEDKYLGVIKRQLPDSVQRLTVSVLRSTAGTEQTLHRTVHQFSWWTQANLAAGSKMVKTSFANQSDVMVSASNFGDTPVEDLGVDQSLPFLIPNEATDSDFADLEQEIYELAARLKSAA